jgi:hypothetical protein
MISPSWKAQPTLAAPSVPADEPSRPTPITTPATASHSRPDSLAFISQAAKTAVTARFAAMIAWTANSGSLRSATSWATNPTMSISTLHTNRHWPSIRTTRPGSTRCSDSALAAERWLARRTAIACMTEAIP